MKKFPLLFPGNFSDPSFQAAPIPEFGIGAANPQHSLSRSSSLECWEEEGKEEGLELVRKTPGEAPGFPWSRRWRRNRATGAGGTGRTALWVGKGWKQRCRSFSNQKSKKSAEMMEISAHFSPKTHRCGCTCTPHPSAQSQERGILSQNPEHGTGNYQTTPPPCDVPKTQKKPSGD